MLLEADEHASQDNQAPNYKNQHLPNQVAVDLKIPRYMFMTGKMNTYGNKDEDLTERIESHNPVL